MREFKFRFWVDYKVEGMEPRMILPVEYADILIKGDGRIFCWIDIQENAGLAEFDKGNVIPMQYTGILDKNGKEIYEGDLLEVDHKISTVKFKETKARFYLYRKFTGGDEIAQGLHETRQSRYRVVGNIYENPELS